YFYRQVVSFQRGQLLHCHLEAAVTDNSNNCFIRESQLSTDCRRKSKAHSAEPAGCDEVIRLVKFVELSTPHLMLADVCRHYRFAAARFISLFHKPQRCNQLITVFIPERILFFV